jgi:hypothetical protein
VKDKIRIRIISRNTIEILKQKNMSAINNDKTDNTIKIGAAYRFNLSD